MLWKFSGVFDTLVFNGTCLCAGGMLLLAIVKDKHNRLRSLLQEAGGYLVGQLGLLKLLGLCLLWYLTTSLITILVVLVVVQSLRWMFATNTVSSPSTNFLPRTKKEWQNVKDEILIRMYEQHIHSQLPPDKFGNGWLTDAQRELLLEHSVKLKVHPLQKCGTVVFIMFCVMFVVTLLHDGYAILMWGHCTQPGGRCRNVN